MTRLLTPAEYADAYRYLREQTTARDRAEVAALIEERTVPLDAEMHRHRALKRWRDTPTQQEQRRAVLADADARRTTTRGAAA